MAVNHFRARVEIILREKGWTTLELARALGKSRQRTKDIINRGDPKTSVLKEFSDALGVEIETLMTEVTPEEYGEKFIPSFPTAQV